MGNELHGGCQCGSLRYVVRQSVKFRVYACHCTDCQSQTGSAFSLHLWLLTGDLELTGEAIAGQQQRDNGSTTTTFGCPNCLSRVYSSNSARAQVVTLRVGTLDNSAQVAPDLHLWTRSKQSWIALPADVMRFETQPATPEEWQEIIRP